MITRIFIITVIYAHVAFAENLQLINNQLLIKMGEYVQLVPRPVSDAIPAKATPGFQNLLDRVNITPSKISSPKSYIVSGRVVSDNTGGALERIPIYVGSQSESPRLAAMTNIDGEFKFQLWIKQDNRDCEIQVPEDLSGYLYIGGNPTTTEYREQRLVAGFSRRYTLKSLMDVAGDSQKNKTPKEKGAESGSGQK